NIAFGSIEAGFSSGAQELTIQAHGPGSLQLNDIYLAGADQSDFTLDLNGGASPCGSTSLLLRQGGACTVTLTFSPGASPGAKSALLVLLSDSPVTGSLTVMLSGTGTPGPVPAIALSKNSLDFGTVDAAEFSEKTLTLTNNGTGDLTLGTINGSDPLGSPFSIVTDTCTGQSVPASGTCDITVRFKPATVSAAAHGIGGLGVIMLGMVMASGITRRRKALAVLLIGAVMAVSLLAACGGGDGGDTNDEGEGTSTYSDTFNVPSDDPDTPNITVNVSGSF
ncbi:MAG: choice-of-anchor D domain-containing protein, partial [Thermodesulfovibrionales bacterium]|nr:choice-of-anchor D domain-containing protein [Thermodesulfovibrionales bacterium]